MKLLKKVSVLLMVLVIFNFSLTSQKTDAVVTKAVTQVAKKIVQEAVKDEAVKVGTRIVLHNIYIPPKSERDKIQTPKTGFTMVCLPENRKLDNTCKVPMQVKKNFTPQDKKAIATKTGQLLDSKMGHKGWKKILDWILPIWIVGAVLTTADLVMDGDISSFFGDLAYDALVSLGFITPLNVVDREYALPDITDDSITDDVFDSPDLDYKYMSLGSNFNRLKMPVGLKYSFNLESDRIRLNLWNYTDSFYLKNIYYPNMTIQRQYFEFVYFPLDKIGGSQYMKNHLYYKLDWKIDDYTIPLDISLGTKIKVDNYSVSNSLTPLQMLHLLALAAPIINGYVPGDQIEVMPEEKPIDLPITKPGSTVTVISPEGIPVRDKTTGTIVKPAEGSTVENPIWIDTNGKPVPEDNVIVGDPVIENTPDGDKIQVPEGTPIVKPGIKPSPENNPDGNPDGNPEDNPEDNPDNETPFVCTENLKKPKFQKLGEELSTTFPFNIPFDLYRSFNNLFVGIGDKKPSFDWDIKAFDKVTTIKITIPDFFDSWMPFIRGIMIFTFDIGILYAILRFTKKG